MKFFPRLAVGAIALNFGLLALAAFFSLRATPLNGEEVGFDVQQLVSDPANLVFAEDFLDAASADRFSFSPGDNWQRVRVGDRYALEHTEATTGYKPPHRSPRNIALINNRHVGSFVLDYEAQQTGREYGHRDACVFFNFEGPANYYYTHIATKSDPHAHQIFVVDDAPRTKITLEGTDGFDWGPSSSWHKVRVVRDIDSGVIQVFVDDMTKPIMKASDKTHAWGAIGFGSFDDTGRVTNIRLYASESRTAKVGF